MAFKIWSLIFSVLLVSTAQILLATEEEYHDEIVLTLDHSNFSDVVAKQTFIVVEFYAPWCGHCMNLAPEYAKAASILSSHDPSIVLAKIDANEDANKEISKNFDVQGFPTIKILRNGGKNIQEYNGPRDADGIVTYLKKQAGPASAEIKSLEDASNLIDEKKIFIVGIFPKFLGEEFETFNILAEKLRADYDFGHTLDAKFISRGESSVHGPILRLLKPFDELVVDVQDFQIEALEKFLEVATVPTVTLFNNDADSHPFVVKFFNSPNSKVMLFFNFSNDVADALKSEYNDAAVLYKGQGVSFLLGDLEASKGVFQYFGLKEDQAPLIFIQSTDEKKYLKTHVEPDQFVPWLKEYLDGSVKPFIRSQPIPQVDVEPVKTVVADSIQDIVFNSGKNVLIEFYAPWCGHCKKLAPILDEVAISFENDSDVMIAKIDSTENDVIDPRFEVKGYPTLYFRTTSGNVVQYEGNRTKDAIINFINNNRGMVVPAETSKDEL